MGSKIYTRGPDGPIRPLPEKFFLPKASTSQYLALVVSEILRGAEIYVRVPCTSCTPLAEIFFVPEASTLLCRMAFLISTFQLFYFPRYQGVPNLHQEALRPLDAIQRIISTYSEYFTISNCVFNFNILPLVVVELLGGPKFRLGGPVPHVRPQGKNLCTRGEYFTMSNGVFNFNFLSLVFSEILGGPKFTLGGPTPPGRPLSEKFFYPKRVRHNI